MRAGVMAVVAASVVAASVVAAVAAAAGAGPFGGGREGGDAAPAARAGAEVRSGSFTQLNSRAGQSIFTAENLAPGQSATGTVTITNAGTLGGRFTLSATDVTDAPGPGAGVLSERLRLAVTDVTAPSSPRTVYSGALAAMPAQPLGYLRGGEARTVRFTASLPDGGSPPSATSGDNAYAGSAASVRFVWDATEAPAATRVPSSPARPASGDRRAPRLRVSIPRVQRVLTRGYLTVRARCDEPCRIDVTGTVRAGRLLRTAPIRGARAAAWRVVRLRVRLPARLRSHIRRTLLRNRTVAIRLKLVARDGAGNRAVARGAVRLRRR